MFFCVFLTFTDFFYVKTCLWLKLVNVEELTILTAAANRANISHIAI